MALKAHAAPVMEFGPDIRVTLIGGSSHAGKSTLARELAARPGWTHVSTDSLGRHPGRPWPQQGQPVKPHVAEHYLSLSVDDLLTDVLAHYAGLWPSIVDLITAHAEDENHDRLVLEGSALWPETVATLTIKGVSALWLTADVATFGERIAKESRLEGKHGRDRQIIEKFLGRTLRYNEQMMQAVNSLGLTSMEL